jgi:hypothetical protein
MSKRLKFIGIAAAVLVCALALGIWWGGRLSPGRPAPPVPNGYDDLLAAAQDAVSTRHLKFGDADDDELRELVRQNKTALDRARVGITRECRVPIDYSVSIAVYSGQHLPVLGQFKKLALAFRAEGELAERENRTNDAVRIYMDGIRFGQELCRGGLLIDRLVGIAGEAINLEPLEALAPELDPATCRTVAQELAKMEARRESVQATFAEEKRWATQSGRLRDRLVNSFIVRVVRPKALQTSLQMGAAKVTQTQLRQRRFILELGARSYEAEAGKPPENAQELVPRYLESIPTHPTSGQPLRL